MLKVSLYSVHGIHIRDYMCESLYEAIELFSMFSKKYTVVVAVDGSGEILCHTCEDGRAYISDAVYDFITLLFNYKIYDRIFSTYEDGHIYLDDDVRELLFNIK